MNVQQLEAVRTRDEVAARIPLFVEAIQAAVDTYFAAHLKNLKPDQISGPVMVGTKYCRIVKEDAPDKSGVGCHPGQRSVWGFIDLSNGDILKAAGWKAPAKHARGNIFDADFSAGNWTAYGPRYL
jgi:hypothetical protein